MKTMRINEWEHLFPSIKTAIIRSAIREYDVWGQDFGGWAEKNAHIIDHVFSEVIKIRQAGFSHYSMRTIVCVIRHHTALSQRGDVTFKINDHVSPDLARLATMLFPELDGFFEFRSRQRVAA